MSLSKFIRVIAPSYKTARLFNASNIKFSTQATAEKSGSSNSNAQFEKPEMINDSFAMNIFCGKLRHEQVVPYPKVLSDDQSDTLKQIIDPTVKFFQEVNNATKNDVNSLIDPNVFEQLKEMGAFGMQVPEELGGVGLNNSQYARVCEILGMYDLGVSICLGAHQSIGFKGISLYGTPEQKEKYLPDLASGKKIACYCLTEPSSGSDASSIQSRAELTADGKHYILNGGKIWISNGGIADIFTVFAKTKVKGENGVEKDKITAFIVERDFGGLTSGQPENKMGIKCSNTAALYFDNVKIPVENVLGGVGNGFKVAMNILNNGRFGMAAALSGTMKECIRTMTEHVTERTQFGSKLKDYGLIQERLANMAMRHYATESMAYVVSGNMDRGIEGYQVEAAISKIFAAENAWFCCDSAIQSLGGTGFMKDCELERVLRDLRIFRIFEGSNDILRLFVSLTSLQYAGKIISKEMKNPMNIASFASAKALRYMGGSSNVECNKMKELCPSELHGCIDQLSQSIGELGINVVEQLNKHRKGIINRQYELLRFADAAIECYAMIAAISRASQSHSNRLPTADYEIKLTRLLCNDYSRRIQFNLRNLSSNLDSENISLSRELSAEMCSTGGVVQHNPLGF